jgi:hypothetical protein
LTIRQRINTNDPTEVNSMKRNKKRIIAAVAVIGALAAGGAAFTNTITGNPVSNGTTAGYANITVNGATLNDANYSFDSTGANITAVNLTFSGNVSADTVQVGFNGAASLTTCAAGTYTTGTPGTTAVTCTVSEATASATSLNVLVSNT